MGLLEFEAENLMKDDFQNHTVSMLCDQVLQHQSIIFQEDEKREVRYAVFSVQRVLRS